ncbi:hypothetical protein GCM10009566_28920 [Streptomyces murinus]|uniref:Transposase InsO family protein n=1 Tax=Streptomyces murinus TaxID=33900 RepID=A0A7W3NVN1_STRMR|nr:transposase InsO family protein [Streptomyces murinus]
MSPRRWDFISDNRADFGVKRLCRVLDVSRSGYYRHQATAPACAVRKTEEERTVAEIRKIHAEHRGAYGAPRVHAELRARGRRVNRKRVTRLMRVNHIVGRHLRRKKRTTIADKTAPPVPDLVMRDFTATALNSKWCGDITYIAVGSTWMYLATVIDICSRRVIRLVDRRPHAHLPGHRRDRDGGRHPRRPGARGRVSHGQGRPVRESDLRRCLPPARYPPQHGADRLEL